MNIYDKVGHRYDDLRGNVGVNDILEQVETLGSEISVLELGCGTGHPVAKEISPKVKRYLGIDNSQPMLDAYIKNVKDARCRFMNMTDIGEFEDKWDFIFSWGAICHLKLESQKKTMASVSKILNPGGLFLFTGGKDEGDCPGKVGEYAVHHYSMGRASYIEFLRKCGMEFIDAHFSEGDFYVYRFRKIF